MDFKWDSGVLHSSINAETGTIKMLYSGLISTRPNTCSKVFSIDIHLNQLVNGFIESMSYLQGGVKSTAHILYIDDDTFIWYECHGSVLTPYGDCVHGMEQVDIYSRRKKVNTDKMSKLLAVVRQKTCLDTSRFVFANHTKKCHLPGITDNEPMRAERSCKVKDIPAQQDVNITRLSGLWYEKERTRFSPHNTWESSLSLYEASQSGALTFRHAGTERGLCKGPVVASALPVSPGSGEMQLYVGSEGMAGSPWAMHFVFKVLYTDYDTLVTYACKFVRSDGQCGHYARQLDILSRSKDDLHPRVYERLHKVIKDTVCLDIHDFVTPVYQEDCHPLLGVLAPPRIVDCPNLKCLPCTHGYLRDENDCQTCQCVQPIAEVEVACTVPVCTEECTGGRVLDEQGCETCICKADQIAEVQIPCAEPMCKHFCPGGYKKTQQGCNTCECVPEEPAEVQIPCPEPLCRDFCPGGYMKNQQGCNTCQCVPQEPVEEVVEACSERVCDHICPAGYVQDEKGCDTCDCLQEVPDESVAIALSDLCPLPFCADHCPAGYALDSRGCQTCLCNDANQEEGSGDVQEESEENNLGAQVDENAVGGEDELLERPGDDVWGQAALVEQPSEERESLEQDWETTEQPVMENVTEAYNDSFTAQTTEQPEVKIDAPCLDTPPRVQFAAVTYRRADHGDRAIYECRAGYIMVGDYFLTCNNGEWVGRPPRCDLVFCPYPGDLHNGKMLLVGRVGKYTYKPYVKQVKHNDKIEYVCDPGYQLEGPSEAYCVEGYWSPQLMATCNPVQDPQGREDTHLNGSEEKNGPLNDGQMVGGQRGEEERSGCPYPGDLNNGKILLVGRIGKYIYRTYLRPVKHNVKIEYVCDPGYQLEGPSEAYCVEGYWSPQLMARCNPVQDLQAHGRADANLNGSEEENEPLDDGQMVGGQQADRQNAGEEKGAVRGEEESTGLIDRLTGWMKQFI